MAMAMMGRSLRGPAPSNRAQRKNPCRDPRAAPAARDTDPDGLGIKLPRIARRELRAQPPGPATQRPPPGSAGKDAATGRTTDCSRRLHGTGIRVLLAWSETGRQRPATGPQPGQSRRPTPGP